MVMNFTAKDKWFLKKEKDTKASVKEGEDFTFECRPTSPDFTVKFFGPRDEVSLNRMSFSVVIPREKN